MKLADFFTEFDDAVAGEANIDPLGTLVIWSAYGQQVFKSRISSISNDARSYTLNLFHHNLIRNLIANDGIKLSRTLEKRYQKKDSLAFKQACLLYLEKLFVFSVTENETARWIPDVDSSGVLGILKGRQIHAQQGTVKIGFAPDQEILIRQLLLGVSGRYKTPMVEMGFFDKAYRYDLNKSRALWTDAEAFISKDHRFRALQEELARHFKALFEEDTRVPAIEYGSRYVRLKKAYLSAFPSSADVGKRARKFWLAVTGLDKGVPGAMLKVVDAMKADALGELDSRQMFKLATDSVRLQRDTAGLQQISHIESVEPFLADLELLFTLMISKGVRNIADVEKRWAEYRRSAMTIPSRAEKLAGDQTLVNVLSGTARARLDTLLALSGTTSLVAQIRAVADYHKKVTDSRGQGPWLAIDTNGNIKVFVGRSDAPQPASRLNGYWKHHYYIPQFLNLVRGFQGVRV